ELGGGSEGVGVRASLIWVTDIAAGPLVVNPLADPPLHAEFVLIQPARRTLSPPARLFLEGFEAEVARSHAIWDAAIATAERGKSRVLRAASRGTRRTAAAP